MTNSCVLVVTFEVVFYSFEDMTSWLVQQRIQECYLVLMRSKVNYLDWLWLLKPQKSVMNILWLLMSLLMSLLMVSL